jgi:muramoyltetrapeptide carboxypeptidase LdcA involved in peptidoglycan recycling
MLIGTVGSEGGGKQVITMNFYTPNMPIRMPRTLTIPVVSDLRLAHIRRHCPFILNSEAELCTYIKDHRLPPETINTARMLFR